MIKQIVQAIKQHRPTPSVRIILIMVIMASTLSGCETSPFDNGVACIDHLNDAPLNQHNERFTLPDGYIDLRTQEGQSRLNDCALCADYPNLSSAFLTQATQTFCGLASSTMVLNADETSRVLRPITKPYEPFHYYTQCNLLNDTVREKIDTQKILRGGMELTEINYILSNQPSTEAAQCFHASDATIENFTEKEEVLDHCDVRKTKAGALAELKNGLSTPGQYVIINFAKAPYETRGGHFSPLAAYHKASDSFLIMDVARYKYPPFWIKADALWDSMRSIDNDSGKARGFIILTTKPGG